MGPIHTLGMMPHMKKHLLEEMPTGLSRKAFVERVMLEVGKKKTASRRNNIDKGTVKTDIRLIKS